MEARNLFVILGGHDLSQQFENGRQTIAVKRIKMHNDWNPSERKFSNDIAVITLLNPVSYSNFIRPICIPSKKLHFSSGTVAGWGIIDDHDTMSNLPRKVELPILSDGDCFRNDPRLALISWPESFCAGKVGSGVCRGDSGSGLYVKENGQYFLKGIVSSSVASLCSETYLVLYTEISAYEDFITTECSKDSILNSGIIGTSKPLSIDVDCVNHG